MQKIAKIGNDCQISSPEKSDPKTFYFIFKKLSKKVNFQHIVGHIF